MWAYRKQLKCAFQNQVGAVIPHLDKKGQYWSMLCQILSFGNIKLFDGFYMHIEGRLYFDLQKCLLQMFIASPFFVIT